MPLTGTQSKLLTGSQFKSLHQALVDAFDRVTLAMMLKFELDKQLSRIAGPDDIDAVVFKLIEKSEMQGWTLDLVRAARTTNPGNPKLFEVAQSLSVTSARDLPVAVAAMELEKIVRPGVPFQDPAALRSRLGRIELQVCSIEIDGIGFGSGVLVGPDYILTNQHVIANASATSTLACRFDFAASADGKVISQGVAVPARLEPVDSSPPSPNDPNLAIGDPTDDECDYALLKLGADIGNAPAGSGANPSAEPRGWVKLAAGLIEPGDPMFVLQHPQSPLDWKLQPLKLTMGAMLELVGGGRRLRHSANTLPGSSGSPCFSAAMSLVALHHAGGDDRYVRADFNQAIPIGKIIDRLTRQGVTPFWEASPPEGLTKGLSS
ncbi:hypothetical protein HNR60_002808 [Rhodopseudomonas rhenobacensis]|uniref:Serine protease n=1 Tax=Rhodopseudomonas rhenobacensis TaxID=87461 RepID=A0A7W8DZN6_9BRAD|nr:effector-associated domain EAD1-containing protein [Rhodopseudomonas rhenobacensis]MBB5048047.1 hypothetical protein [Rhodopseudomonas rhenobacensis]